MPAVIRSLVMVAAAAAFTLSLGHLVTQYIHLGISYGRVVLF
jgi:hypothetical protein